MFYTRERAKQIQGIAILLMIYHHEFSNPSSFAHFTILGTNIEQSIGWFGKICVAIYAFTSGYGMFLTIAKVLSGLNDADVKSLKKIYKSGYKPVLKRVISFILCYWIVFAFFLPFNLYRGRLTSMSQILKGIFFLETDFNGGWWYVPQYLEMVLVSPLLVILLYKFRNLKFKSITALVLVVLGVVMRYLGSFILLYFVIFGIGMVVARYDIFESIATRLANIGDIGRTMITVLLLLACIVVRIGLSTSASDATMDIVVAPLFIFACSACIPHSRVLNYLGEHSLWMWLVSTSVQSVWNKYIIRLYWSGGIYVFIVTVTLVISILLERFVYKPLYRKMPKSEN